MRVVIAGGGVIGTMIAFFAARRGCDVLQLEREDAPRGASIRNFGLVWISGRRAGEELAFALRSRALWTDVGAAVPELGFRPNGSLTILQHDAELAVVRETLARDDARDRGLSLLGPADVREVNPAVRGEVLAALHCSCDAAVEPRRVPEALRRLLLDGKRYEWLPARHVVEIADQAVRDHTGQRHEGDAVVVCPGAAHRGLLGWNERDAPLRRVRLQMLETDPVGAGNPDSSRLKRR